MHPEGEVGCPGPRPDAPTKSRYSLMTTSRGIDEDAVTSWLVERVDALDLPLTFSMIAGGRSNLTFRIQDTRDRGWVLRRPPLHGVLPSAHDMQREHRIISSLWASPVPVPRAVGYEPDTAIIGAPFYVMDYIEGRVVRDAEDARALDADRRRRAGSSLIDVLVALHELDPDGVGLGDLGKKEDYLARQLHRWHGQLKKGQEQGHRKVPILDEVHAQLVRSIPPQHETAIVHGDYRIDNVILGSRGEVVAVLDWELCTLGDPLADVGLLAVYWSDPHDDVIPLASAPTTVEGFLRRNEIIDLYAIQSGRDLSDLDYYIAFAFWKLAAILEGVYSRQVAGAYGTFEETSEALGANVERLGDVALHRLAASRRST